MGYYPSCEPFHEAAHQAGIAIHCGDVGRQAQPGPRFMVANGDGTSNVENLVASGFGPSESEDSCPESVSGNALGRTALSVALSTYGVGASSKSDLRSTE